MSWQDQQSPWGKQGGPSSPEEFIAKILKQIKEAFSGGGGGGQDDDQPQPAGPGRGVPKGLLGKLAIIVAIIILFNMANSFYYTIKPGEKGVVLRFGKYSKTSNPGLNFKIPMVDQVVKVDIETVRKEEFGFRTKIPGQKSVYDKRGYDNESLMLTGDKNVIDVEWIVQYKVSDPFNFIFKVTNVPQAVRDIAETVTRRIVGNMDFDYVLSNRDVLAVNAAREIQQVLNNYEAGVDIVTLQLQDVNPPDAVKPAFNEVNEADQDMKRLVNEAEEAYNRVIPKARGSAKRVLEEAKGYAVERVNESKGDTARFLAVLEEYLRAKEVTRQRLYLETMQEVMPSVTDIYLVDKEQQGILPLLNLGKK
jgi:membrane protease subunit HflK